jgi:ABC-type Fe2+-enterobactin transport system substrate-binding protein
VRRSQVLLSTVALGIAIAVISVHVLLSDHLDIVETAMRLGGAALLAIAAALIASTATPPSKAELARVRPSLPRR